MAKIPVPLSFDWDSGNIEKSWIKHKVSYKQTEEVFFNKPLRIFEDIRHSQKENRFIALGITNKNRKLYIVFTIRNQKIRIISARNQSKKERKLYVQKKA